LAQGFELTEAGIKISEDMEWNEQRVATTGQGIMSLLASCGEILKEVFVWPDFSA